MLIQVGIGSMIQGPALTQNVISSIQKVQFWIGVSAECASVVQRSDR